jgi:hypothetical protein
MYPPLRGDEDIAYPSHQWCIYIIQLGMKKWTNMTEKILEYNR